MENDVQLVITALADQLRAEIAASGKSMAAVSREIDVHYQTLFRYAHGKRDIPYSVIVKVGRAIGVSPAVIMSRAEDRLLQRTASAVH